MTIIIMITINTIRRAVDDDEKDGKWWSFSASAHLFAIFSYQAAEVVKFNRWAGVEEKERR